jgi:tRNA uridine 5-carboxymethylaminomethyl modification enzyme
VWMQRNPEPAACGGARGERVQGREVVLARGTLPNGVVHIGDRSSGAGRPGERLRSLTLPVGRLRMGTVAWVAPNSIQVTRAEEVRGAPRDLRFAVERAHRPDGALLPCWWIATPERTRDTIGAALDQLVLATGGITAIGPRCCRSIESAIMRFADRVESGGCLEGGGWARQEVYVQATSNSLLIQVQRGMLYSSRGRNMPRRRVRATLSSAIRSAFTAYSPPLSAG